MNELSGGGVNTFIPTQNQVIIGLPKQEKGVRPARALPYELHAHGQLNASKSTFELEFSNTGKAGAVFEVRSGNPADTVRMYTVEPGKKLSGTWTVGSQYDLSVYGPNGFARYFKGSTGRTARPLSSFRPGTGRTITAQSSCESPTWASSKATVILLDAYTGEQDLRFLRPGETLEDNNRLDRFYGWYDLVVKVNEDPTFECRLAGHVETGDDSFSDPALGGLVTLKA